MKKQLALAAAVMAVGSVAMATDYYTAGDVVVTGAKLDTFTQPWCDATTITGTGSSWSVNIGSSGKWTEGGASYTFKVPAHTTVTLKSGTVTSNLPNSGAYWGDIIMYATTVDPKTADFTGLVGMGDLTWDASYSSGQTTAQAYADGFDYFAGDGSYGNWYTAIMNYGSNVENLALGGGQTILGGEYAFWTQGTGAPSGATLSSIQYTWAAGLQRCMKDQVNTFSGSFTTTGDSDWYITVVVKGGYEPQGTGSIAVDNLTIGLTHDFNAPNAFPGYGAKTIQYNEMTSWKNQGTFTGTDGSWTMTITSGVAWQEQGAYYAVVLPPYSKATVTGGELTTNMPTGDYYNDYVFFGMPGVGSGIGSVIANRVAGPSVSSGTVAYMTGDVYKYGPVPHPTAGGSGGYRGASGTDGAAENPSGINASTQIARDDGFDYVDSGSYTSYGDAIMNYGANADNFRVADKSLGIKGGVIAGVTWNTSSRNLPLHMDNVAAVSLTSTSVAYNGHGLGRALEDQIGTVSKTIINNSSQPMTIVFGTKTGWSSTLSGLVTVTDAQITFYSAADFNNDGVVDAVDVTTLNEAVFNGSTDLAYDMNGDDVVDRKDFDLVLIDLLGSYYGDTNLDGVVDFEDYYAFLDGWDYGGNTWDTADFDGSGSVDFEDYYYFLDGWDWSHPSL